MPHHQLTKQQLAFFDTFGYLGFPGLLADRVDEIISDFEEVWDSHGGGHNGRPHDGTARSCIVQFIDLHDRLSTLLDDERITGIASSLLGDDLTTWEAMEITTPVIRTGTRTASMRISDI